MKKEKKELLIMMFICGAFILSLFIGLGLSARKMDSGEHSIGYYTHGNTRYNVKSRDIYSKEWISYLNPNPDPKAKIYIVEVQKQAKDENGINVWKHEKTIDYGNKEPKLVNEKEGTPYE